MIDVVFPPGWMSIHPLQPLGIATASARLREAGLDSRPVDLDIVIHEMNRNDPDHRLPVDELTSGATLTRHLRAKGDLRELHREHATSVGRLMGSIDLGESRAVAFSIIGERQLVSASILAGFLSEQGIPTLAGGCFVRDHADWIASLGVFDALFTGFDGSELVRFCREAMDGRRRAGDRSRPEIFSGDDEMARLPKPHFSRELAGRYRSSLKSMYHTEGEHLVLQYQVDQGCNRRCSFCTRFHHIYRRKPVDKMVREISELSQEHETPLFGLVTNAVNIDERYSMEIFRELASANGRLEWYAYAFPEVKDPALFDVMTAAGCRVLRFGLESASDSMLELLNKRFTSEQAVRSFRLAHERGIWVQVSLMVGCPGETEEDIDAVCRFIEEHEHYIDSIRINPFFLQKGSDIMSNPESYGIRIRPRTGGFVGFDEVDGPSWEEKVAHTLGSIERIDAVRRRCGIGYWGLSSNLLLCGLHENGTPEATKRWFVSTHPETNENISSEAIRWRFYHAHEMELSPFEADWASIYGVTFEEGLCSQATPDGAGAPEAGVSLVEG
jgi:pyruvate-formate lyase-activating enzyme